MSTSMSNTGSKTDSTNPQSQNTNSSGYVPEVPAPAEVVDENKGFDDLGYALPIEVKPEEKIPAPADVKPEEVKPVTGYTKPEEKIPAPADVKPEVKPEEVKPADDVEAVKKSIVEVINNLGETYDKEKISKFALDNKLTKEQAEAYVKFTKEYDETLIKQREESVKAQRQEWAHELIRDPVFGGDNFDKNVDRVEKVLQNYMGNTKKVLTEKGGMLPPYIMKDLLSLAKALNPTTQLVTGEASKTEKDEGNFLDEMYN